MKNVEFAVNGNMLTITVDLSKDFGMSATGKSVIISTTEGNRNLPGRNEIIGLNIYKRKIVT